MTLDIAQIEYDDGRMTKNYRPLRLAVFSTGPSVVACIYRTEDFLIKFMAKELVTKLVYKREIFETKLITSDHIQMED